MNQASALRTPVHETRLRRFEGRVQGVGFRPFVWRLAQTLSVSGQVYNEGDAACVLAQGECAVLDVFYRRLLDELPANARVERVTNLVAPALCCDGFTIAKSNSGSVLTRFPLETRCCDACLTEVDDPANRRYGYAFTNCMDCGPRYSIIDALPYDRASTSMSAFPLCASCRAEYEDPADRRFHAQPIACPDCGPQLSFLDAAGDVVAGEPLLLAIDALRRGKILAIKGLGGFHIACDATNADAVMRLRERKQRPSKPFAVMVANVAAVAAVTPLTTATEAALLAPENAIVLLPWSGEGMARAVAPGQMRVGVMLASTPLHHLLLQALRSPLVMTSGNISGQPQCIDEAVALAELGDVVDGFLTHNRPILNRLDDSVVCPTTGGTVVLRRGRGLAPAPAALPDGFPMLPGILGVGAHLKNSCALSTEQGVLVSAHVGDLESQRAQQEAQRAIELLLRGTRLTPRRIVTDHHPDYASSQIGQTLARTFGVPTVAYQHHHAHMAACLFENLVPLDAAPVLGLIIDGMGLAEDGSIWGGEWLLGGYRSAKRVGHLHPRPLLGGHLAMREPWRNLLPYLLLRPESSLCLEEMAAQPQLLQQLERFGLDALSRLANNPEFSPQASSGGRLIDAMAAVVLPELGRQSFEGEAGMALEALALSADDPGEPYRLLDHATAKTGVLDLADLILAGLQERASGVDRHVVAWRMLAGFADALAQHTAALAARHNVSSVALSGGVFQNPMLVERLTAQLSRQQLTVLRHRSFSANDENIALGQVACALAGEEED